jgi:pilus assembly protein FimV
LSNKKGEGGRVRKSLVKQLAIPLGRQTTPTKWLVMLKLLWVAAGLALSASTYAVGMGGINVTSALGQPLKADIELAAISKFEKDSLVARLASPDAYKSAGLEYPYGNNFKFQIESRGDGQPYIRATSAQPVNDPFVSLLVELTWSAGKLSREYTFLLDPPGYVAEQPAKAEVQAVAPEVQAASPVVAASAVPAAPEESAVTPAVQAAPIVAVTPEEQSAPAEAATKSEEQTAPMETAAKPEQQAVPMEIETEPQEQAASAVVAVPKEWIEVQRGDTMYKIAARYKLADMNLDRMLVALYRANADKFDGRNMNRIRAGKILQLPSQQELTSVSLPDAIKEIHAQASDWNAYRQKLASAAPVSNQSQDAQQVATGKISSSIADMAPVAKESAKEVLKLSKGEAPGDQVGTGAGGKSMSEQDKKNAAQEDAIAKNKALKEGQERTALLEKNLKDMQHLAQLKAESAALAQPPVVAAAISAVSATTSTVKPTPAAAAISAVSATASTVKPTPVAVQPKPKQVKPEPSILDQVLVEPLYLAGIAAALLVLGGLGLMLYRRKKKYSFEDLSEPSDDVGEITGRMAAPVFPSPDTGDFTGVASAQAAASSQSDNVDPISEADLFLNFGRDVQAEEILKEALQSTPNNHQIHLKLLEIYAARKDANSFSTIARQLQGSGDDDAWQQAAAMGRKLEPDNPMYGGGFRSMEDTGSATVQMPAFNATTEAKNVPKAQASALDFDFDVGSSAAQESPSPEQDFLGAQRTSIMSADGKLVAQGTEMDFDITSTNPSVPTMEPKAGKTADDGGMAFTLDFPVEKVTEKPAIHDVGFAGISLNFDDVAAPSGSASGNNDDHWQDVATKLDLAKAYHEMGDASGAREILEEVLREGDIEQRQAAQNLFELLG